MVYNVEEGFWGRGGENTLRKDREGKDMAGYG